MAGDGVVEVPRWAVDLVERVARDARRPDRPVVCWHRRRSRSTELLAHGSTVAWLRSLSRGVWTPRSRVDVTAGDWSTDARAVLLHEMAHWLTRDGHTPRFWDRCFDLFARYLSPQAQAWATASSCAYRAEAAVAATRARAPGHRRPEDGVAYAVVEAGTGRLLVGREHWSRTHGHAYRTRAAAEVAARLSGGAWVVRRV